MVIPLCEGCREELELERRHGRGTRIPSLIVHDHYCRCPVNDARSGKHYPGTKHVHGLDAPWSYARGVS
jgi:hypothetical protein